MSLFAGIRGTVVSKSCIRTPEIPIHTCTNFRLGDGSFVHSVRSVILCAVPQFGLNLFDFWELNGAGDIIL